MPGVRFKHQFFKESHFPVFDVCLQKNMTLRGCVCVCVHKFVIHTKSEYICVCANVYVDGRKNRKAKLLLTAVSPPSLKPQPRIKQECTGVSVLQTKKELCIESSLTPQPKLPKLSWSSPKLSQTGLMLSHNASNQHKWLKLSSSCPQIVLKWSKPFPCECK